MSQTTVNKVMMCLQKAQPEIRKTKLEQNSDLLI